MKRLDCNIRAYDTMTPTLLFCILCPATLPLSKGKKTKKSKAPAQPEASQPAKPQVGVEAPATPIAVEEGKE